ncbi:phosphatase PAP2 family protein [Paraburkholderia sp. D1E]|uniref:phosphatase PAP2 family protein n=1 Tax=Paraburkholderia sp. D1E TaxID=3461398 RepID=UPI004045F548
MILLIDVTWLHLTNRSVRWTGIEYVCKAVGALICSVVVLRAVRRIPRYERITAKLRYAEVSDTAAWFSLLLCFMSSASILSYLCVSINAPLVDNSLVRFDRALGFDWPGVYLWVKSHSQVQQILALAYESGFWQLLAIPAILGISGCHEDLSEFFVLLMLSAILLLIISTPFPATSAFVYFKVADPNTASTVSDFAILRDGTMRIFDLRNMQGLVSIPSFHTMLAVLFTYSLRRIRLLFGLAIVINTTMIVSTPTQGGHYLFDVIAGLLLSVLIIQALRVANRQRTVVPPTKFREAIECVTREQFKPTEK